jgi:hypothetical protein
MTLAPFDPATYPGPRPDGAVLVRRGLIEPVDPDDLASFDGWRFSVAYGSNASPARLVQKGLDRAGALLLPAVIRDHVAGFEQRRTGYGSVPLTLLPEPGATTATWVLGIPASATELLDRTEGRVVGPAPSTPGTERPGGRFAPPGTYQLGHVGPVTVAERWQLTDGLAYLPGPSTRVQLGTDGRWRRWPDVDQGAAARHADQGGPARAAPPPTRVVQGAWPRTPLIRLA